MKCKCITFQHYLFLSHFSLSINCNLNLERDGSLTICYYYFLLHFARLTLQRKLINWFSTLSLPIKVTRANKARKRDWISWWKSHLARRSRCASLEIECLKSIPLLIGIVFVFRIDMHRCRYNTSATPNAHHSLHTRKKIHLESNKNCQHYLITYKFMAYVRMGRAWTGEGAAKK